jgi:glycosyltransferase involved in cell wall biosynthesis
MATFNGAKHVEEQICSILNEIGPSDEVIVIDDRSSDDTVARVRAFADPRIRVYVNESNVGYVRNFERAIGLARGDHVFLSDQDDLWPAGRVEVMQRGLLTHQVVAGNVGCVDAAVSVRPQGVIGSWRLRRGQEHRRIRMVVKLAASHAPYYGSAMAVRRDLLPAAMPFPPSVSELHDAWLALLGLMSGSMLHVERTVVLRRIHSNNASGRLRSVRKIVVGRAHFVGMCAAAWQRTRHFRRQARSA